MTQLDNGDRPRTRALTESSARCRLWEGEYRPGKHVGQAPPCTETTDSTSSSDSESPPPYAHQRHGRE
eukprot:3091655-Rhodomonas_salina.1